MKNTKRLPTLLIILLIVLVIGAVYFISGYTKKHNEKEPGKPTISDLRRSGDEKAP